MEKLATKVIDIKDDVSGSILKEIFPKYENIPEVLKTASRQEPKDHEYALIMMNDGQKFRKFATHDAGNTALSVLYFLKTASELPIEAIKIAADSLINASGRFRLPIPPELKELAEGMSSQGIEVRTREKFWRPLDSLTRVGELDAGRAVEKTAGVVGDVARGGLVDGVIGYRGSKWNKEAQVSATEIARERGLIDATKEAKFKLPVGLVDDMVKRYPAVSKMTGKNEKTAANAGSMTQKNSIKRMSNTINVSKMTPSQPMSEKIAKYTLLEGEYPVDTFEQIKLAQEYFSEHWRELPPRIRHEYCVKLSQRAESLDAPVTNEVSRYGSETYSTDLEMHLNQRKDFVPEELHEVLDKLEKKASVVSPYVFAEALAEFDKFASIDRYWDSRLADPYRATFGPSFQKQAEDNWNFTEMGLYINEQDLKTLAYQHIEKVRKQFGQIFAAKFVGNPKGVFEKQDHETKILLARMASHDY